MICLKCGKHIATANQRRLNQLCQGCVSRYPIIDGRRAVPGEYRYVKQ